MVFFPKRAYTPNMKIEVKFEGHYSRLEKIFFSHGNKVNLFMFMN